MFNFKSSGVTCKLNYLNVTTQWKVFSQWMSLKSIVGENSPKIGMIRKKYAKHVPNFSFVPIGSRKNTSNGINRSQLVGVSFDSNPRIESNRQKNINKLKKKIKLPKLICKIE